MAPGILAALTFHWKVGKDPPLVGVAEKVTEVPLQTGLLDGEIETLTGRLGLTTIVTVFDEAGLPVTHMALDVRMQVTASAFVGT